MPLPTEMWEDVASDDEDGWPRASVKREQTPTLSEPGSPAPGGAPPARCTREPPERTCVVLRHGVDRCGDAPVSQLSLADVYAIARYSKRRLTRVVLATPDSCAKRRRAAHKTKWRVVPVRESMRMLAAAHVAVPSSVSAISAARTAQHERAYAALNRHELASAGVTDTWLIPTAVLAEMYRRTRQLSLDEACGLA